MRDDSSVATCVAFVGGSDIVAAGSHTGEIRMIDAGAGEVSYVRGSVLRAELQLSTMWHSQY